MTKGVLLTMLACSLLNVSAACRVYTGHELADTVLHAVTLRYRLPIKLAISPRPRKLTRDLQAVALVL